MIANFLLNRRHFATFMGILSILGVLLYIFAEPLFSSNSFFPPVDGGPFFLRDHQARVLSFLTGAWINDGLGRSLGAWPLVPSRVLEIVLPPLLFHPFRYAFNTLLLVLATSMLLHARGMRGIAKWLPSAGMAFSGYTFTLISAGHGGYFDMAPFAVFTFACIDFGFQKRSVLWFCWAAVCAAFGTPQPDVMALFMFLAFAYAVFLFFTLGPDDKNAKHWMKYTARIVLCAVAAAGVFVAVASSSFIGAVRAIETRESVRGQTADAKWEFATNWSMPPEELLDLVAPFVFGIETGDPAGPYWGRLGRSMRWHETRQGLMNLKQHTLYMGIIPILFAFFLLIYALSGKQSVNSSHSCKAIKSTSERHQIIFWAVAFIVCLLLAMGRFTPLYRLFYELPFFSRIRAPVKFLHLSELALAVLFAHGVMYFIADLNTIQETTNTHRNARANAQPARKRVLSFCMLSAVVGGLFLLLASVLPDSTRLGAYWNDLQIGQFTGLLQKVMRGGLLRSTLFALVIAGASGLALTQGIFIKKTVICVIWIALLLDVATVGRRYLRTGDISPFYNTNPVVSAIHADDDKGRTAFYLGAPVLRNWTFVNMMLHGTDILQPMLGDHSLPENEQMFFSSLQSNPLKLWALTSTRYIVGTTQQLQSLVDHPDIEVALRFTLDAGRFRLGGADSPYVLLKYKQALPRANIYYNWIYADDREVLRQMEGTSWDYRKKAFVADSDIESGSNDAVGTARIISNHKPNVIKIACSSSAPGLLVLSDKYDAGWQAKVDGVSADIHRVNYIMRGVFIPKGESTVVFGYRPNQTGFIISLCAVIFMLMWSFVVFINRKLKR